jgi:hypothetical protein
MPNVLHLQALPLESGLEVSPPIPGGGSCNCSGSCQQTSSG